MDNTPDWVEIEIQEADQICLFLDYDGTLADFAPNPDVVIPEDRVISLIARLVEDFRMVVSIVSGRRLQHIQKLLPIQGLWLAGTYGIELQAPNGQLIHRLQFSDIRPTLDRLKPDWQSLINNRIGFYLEDKGWSLAIHAKDASPSQAVNVLYEARHIAEREISGKKFQLLGGDKFLEFSPIQADKGNTVEYILNHYRDKMILPIYIGDDDKDEAAFKIIKRYYGITIYVSKNINETISDMVLKDTCAVHYWLNALHRN